MGGVAPYPALKHRAIQISSLRGEVYSGGITPAALSTREDLVEILQRLLASGNTALGQGVEDLGATHSRKLCGTALGDPALGIPDDRSRQADLPGDLLRRSPQRRKNISVEFHLYAVHRWPPNRGTGLDP